MSNMGFKLELKKALRTLPDQDAVNNAVVSMDSGAAPNGAGVSLSESATPGVFRSVITLTDANIPLVDEAAVVAYGSLKVLDMPQGVVQFMGAVADIALTKSSAGVIDTWDGDVGVGTAAASNNATLASTEQDIIPTTATPQAVAGATTADAISTATEAGATFDGRTTPVDVYLNLLVDDADHDVTSTACNLIANGTITITWAFLGDA
jgi:hypothetical protein